MTKNEVWLLIRQLETVFDMVRLVDVSMTRQFSITSAGDIREEPYQCYTVWNKNQRCENCISTKAFACKGKMTKFEFVDNDVYYVMSMYVEMDGVPYILEMVSKVTDETLFSAYGKNAFIELISNYNRRLYVDPLTGAYNRQYYEEQLNGLTNVSAIAMLDMDNFKSINDSLGHQAGDAALRAVVRTVFSCIRSTDAAVRYGGDEFLIVFRDLTKDFFISTLEKIRDTVSSLVLKDYPELRLSVSIGGVYCPGSAQDAVRKADALLYKAKGTRNAVEWE